MKTINFTDEQSSLLYTALRSAAIKYDEIAESMKVKLALPQLAEHFERQADATRALARLVVEAENITVTPWKERVKS